MYDPAYLNWTQIDAPDSPGARAYHGVASARDKLYIHGGLIFEEGD